MNDFISNKVGLNETTYVENKMLSKIKSETYLKTKHMHRLTPYDHELFVDFLTLRNYF